jgi:hypothetical protein
MTNIFHTKKLRKYACYDVSKQHIFRLVSTHIDKDKSIDKERPAVSGTC